MGGADVVVIGAGIVGLATARAFAVERRAKVLVLETERGIAEHQTGRNSGVVHSGLYYRPGSDKAALCAAGREALFAYAAEHGIAHERCGKVVVAVEERELPALEELERRGRANGLSGLERLDRTDLARHEPGAAGTAGLYVPQTGIVDYRAVARALHDDLIAAGGQVWLDARAGRIRAAPGRVVIETSRGAVAAQLLIACAGLESDRVARRAGLAPSVRIVPFRGDYFRLAPSARALVRHLVYPVPDPELPFLGVHFTRRVDGEVEAGPNAVLAWKRAGYSRFSFSARDAAATLGYPGFWRMAPRYARVGWAEYRRAFSRRRFVAELRRLVPAVGEADLVRAGCGVRAQALDRAGRLVDDFVFAEGEGMIHVLNAPSPAATAALAIAARIAARAGHRRAGEA